MKPTIKYRLADNAAYIRLSSAKLLDSAEVSSDVVFDTTRRAASSASNCSTPGRNCLPMR